MAIDRINDLTAPPPDSGILTIKSINDVVRARRYCVQLARQIGFNSTKAMIIDTAVSELARNIVLYAKHGELKIDRVTRNGASRCISIIARDRGPGIKDLSAILQIDYTNPGATSLGLPGVKQIVDSFEIESQLGQGTEVKVLVWQ